MRVLAIDLDGCALQFPQQVRELYEDPTNFIVIYTARSSTIRLETIAELATAKIPYHALVMDKLRADIYIDDKNSGGLQWRI